MDDYYYNHHSSKDSNFSRYSESNKSDFKRATATASDDEVTDELVSALQAAAGILYALPKSAQSKRRTEVLAQVRRALAGLED